MFEIVKKHEPQPDDPWLMRHRLFGRRGNDLRACFLHIHAAVQSREVMRRRTCWDSCHPPPTTPIDRF